MAYFHFHVNGYPQFPKWVRVFAICMIVFLMLVMVASITISVCGIIGVIW